LLAVEDMPIMLVLALRSESDGRGAGLRRSLRLLRLV
jgi:hypothetical protein